MKNEQDATTNVLANIVLIQWLSQIDETLARLTKKRARLTYTCGAEVLDAAIATIRKEEAKILKLLSEEENE